jgi:archaellum component FlaC
VKKTLFLVLIVIVSVSLFAGSLQIDEIGERVEETVDRIMYKDITDVYNFIDSALDKVVALKGYTDRLGSAEQTSELLEKQVELMDSIYEDFKRLSGMRPKIEKTLWQASEILKESLALWKVKLRLKDLKRKAYR